MKRGTLLNQPLNSVIASIGHMDTLAVVDCGYPIPSHACRIELALKRGVPRFLDALDVILEDLAVEGAVIAHEMASDNVELYRSLCERSDAKQLGTVSHEMFKQQAINAKAYVRTGENTPYANILLIAAVAF